MMIRACCVYTVEAAEASQHQGPGSVARKDAETALENLSQGSYQDTDFLQVLQSVFCLPADEHSSDSAPGNVGTNKCCGTKTVVVAGSMSVTGVFDGRDQCLTAFDAHLGQLGLQQGNLSFQLLFVLHSHQKSRHVQS